MQIGILVTSQGCAVYVACTQLCCNIDAGTQVASTQWQVIPLGLAAGLAGSLIDSLLGATLQYSGFDPSIQKVVNHPGDGVMRISGTPLLTNNLVNL